MIATKSFKITGKPAVVHDKAIANWYIEKSLVKIIAKKEQNILIKPCYHFGVVPLNQSEIVFLVVPGRFTGEHFNDKNFIEGRKI